MRKLLSRRGLLSVLSLVVVMATNGGACNCLFYEEDKPEMLNEVSIQEMLKW